MQKLQETQENLFSEIKVLVEKISNFSTEEEFVENVSIINELQQKIISLKNYIEINKIISEDKKNNQNIERQVINFEIDTKKIEGLDENPVEIVSETEDVEETLDEEILVEENVVSEKLDEEYFIEKENQQNELAENIEKESENEISEALIAKEDLDKKEEEERKHEERIKIADISAPLNLTKEKAHHENLQEKIEEIHEERKEHHEKKFKLANIKGLKSTVQSLFDDDPLEKIDNKEAPPIIEEQKQASSLVKSNMPTDYMEAEKTIPDFKLDINDRLAFTKMLFDGSQVELNQLVNRLNSFKTLNEAKEYLSEVYYERKWENADEYAQRLWSLVENKFL